MYNIALCDDDKKFIDYIKNIIIQSGLKKEDINFYEFFSGEELIKSLNYNKEYDLLILDIQMKELNGNMTAKIYREHYQNTTLVFCSGYCRPTVETIEYTPFRYLLKQYDDKKILDEMIQIIKEVIRIKDAPYIIGHYHYNTIKLKPEEILYISLARRGSNIYLCPNIVKYDFEKKITSNQKVSELFHILKFAGFVYAHNSYIVNLKYIKRKTLNEVELTDGTVLSIARSKEKEFRRELAEYFSKKYN